MKIFKYPPRDEWEKLLNRPVFDNSGLFSLVGNILDKVKEKGDAAVIKYEYEFDKVSLQELRVTDDEIENAYRLVPDKLKAAIDRAKLNIEKFHSFQQITSQKIETSTGVFCWQRSVGIEKVGLYIPGGTAPLFSTVLMLAIPARIAGCKEIVLCSPPNKEGQIHPAILYSAKEAGVSSIFKIGGVQAIGAMAYGTESVPKVYKIFGPGNQYVTAAKQIVSLKDVAIDMPAGPSEVEVIADKTASPAFIAADLLSQAEHGSDSQVILLTCHEEIIDDILSEIDSQLSGLKRKKIAEDSLKNSRIILLKNDEEIIDFTNAYAPEHLIIETANYNEMADRIINAGSVFLGHYTPESAGDYASGTNHTLPTNGYSKAYSGVNLDSFVKKITFQEITKDGICELGDTIEVMAEAEELFAHKNAVSLRLKH